jgi:hypothetical protein
MSADMSTSSDSAVRLEHFDANLHGCRTIIPLHKSGPVEIDPKYD